MVGLYRAEEVTQEILIVQMLENAIIRYSVYILLRIAQAH